jgi:alkylhydroperoxidase/carboxymuconolactone decarboxylase family protein YurZ
MGIEKGESMKKFTKIVATLVVAVVCTASIFEAMAMENETLSARQKKMIPISAFTAIGNMLKLETALSEGMDAELTVNEIKEILVQSYAYAGFPRALNDINILHGRSGKAPKASLRQFEFSKRCLSQQQFC